MAANGAQTLQIVVGAELSLEQTPPRLLQALRRQLRRYDLGRLIAHDQSQREVLSLLATAKDHCRMPQALLAPLVDACRRYDIDYAVIDRRAMVACPALRSRLRLSPLQESALMRLLLRDSGVLVAEAPEDRSALAAELMTRRQQRTLLLTTHERVESWRATLEQALAAEPARLGSTAAAQPGARVILGDYQALPTNVEGALTGRYGMVIFDAIESIDPLTLMRAVRGADARYLLGLASSSTREDGLQSPLYLVLGGVAHELRNESCVRALKLAYRRRPTTFSYAYHGREDYQAMLAALGNVETRNQQILSDLLLEARAGHPCLVLSERREHLRQLQDGLPADIPSDAVTSQVRPADRASIVSKLDSGEIRVLFATSQIAVESIHVTCARRLFITFPFSFGQKLERLTKALLEPSPGQEDAVVYDYDDLTIAPLHRACDKRAKVIARVQRAAEQHFMDWAQLPLEIS